MLRPLGSVVVLDNYLRNNGLSLIYMYVELFRMPTCKGVGRQGCR